MLGPCNRRRTCCPCPFTACTPLLLLAVQDALPWVRCGPLRRWVPLGQLVPPVTNRANYIHWLEDLLALSAPPGEWSGVGPSLVMWAGCLRQQCSAICRACPLATRRAEWRGVE